MLRFRVFDPTGATLLGEIANPVEGDFLEEMNAPGMGRLLVERGSADDLLLERDRIVKVFYEDEVRFAWSIETLDREIVTDDSVEVTLAAGRGIMAWLEEAIVFPQAGLTQLASTERPFSFASADGAWQQSASYATPVGVGWRSDTSARRGSPQGWPDLDAEWIWSTSPTTANVPRGTVNWFRRQFTTAAMQQARIWATADSQFELWLDGTLILSSAQFSTDYQGWQQFAAVNVRIPAGQHTLAAFVRSGQPWARSDVPVSSATNQLSVLEHGLADGTQVKVVAVNTPNNLTPGVTYFVRDAATDSFRLAATAGGTAVNVTADSTVDLETVELGTAGFLMSAATLDANALPTGNIVRTNTTGWLVSAVEPQWRPALILKTLVDEAKARNVFRLSGVDTSSFSASVDSASVAWSSLTATNMRVGATLLDVGNELVEQQVDFRVDPVTLALEAYNAQGVDKSAAVRLHPGNSLVSFQTASERKIKTVAVVRTPTGWATTATAGPRRETYLETGGSTSTNVARDLAGKILERTSIELQSANAVNIVARPGCTPYVDFGIGDVISIPSADGATFERARVLSLAGRARGTVTDWSCELGILNGEAGMRRPPRLWEQQVSSRLRAISPGVDLGATVTQPIPPESPPSEGRPPREGDIISLNVPSTPVLQNATQGLVVGWDGKDSSAGEYPSQAFVLIHVSTVNNFTPSVTTVKGVLYAPGIFTIGGLPPDTVHYVKLVGGTDRGIRSAPSAQASLSVTSVVDDIPPGGIDSNLVSFDARALGGIQQFVGPTTPTGGTYFQGDTWVNTTNLSYNVYSGTAWVQQQWGTAAIAASAITSAQIAAGAVTAEILNASAVTGKTITSSLFRTSSLNSRVTMAEATAAFGADAVNFYSGGTRQVSLYYVGGDGYNSLTTDGRFTAATAMRTFGAFYAGGAAIIDGTATLNGTVNCEAAANVGFSGANRAFRVATNGNVFSFGIDSASTANAANVRVGANAQLLKELSTVRIKDNLIPMGSVLMGVPAEKLSEEPASIDPYDVLSVTPTEFESLCEADGSARMLGFIAEDVAAKLPWAAEWDDEGLPSSVQDRPILAALLAVVRDQTGIIEELKSRVETLEAG